MHSRCASVHSCSRRHGKAHAMGSGRGRSLMCEWDRTNSGQRWVNLSNEGVFMGRCRVSLPETSRLSLSDGDYLDVVKDLNAGEYADLLVNLVARKPFTKVMAYVVGWSLVGLENQPLTYNVTMPEDERIATIRSLDKATIHEIIAAIDKHEASVGKELEAKKKTRGGAPASGAVSPSAAS